MLVATLVVISLLLLGAVLVFNRLVTDRNQARAAWSDIDVQLTRRYDLTPQLVAAVQAYADYERATLTAVTELRTRAHTAVDLADRARLEDELGRQIERLLVLAESYPDLKASGNFLQLQRDLVAIEDHLQYARRFYNGAVRDYNDATQKLPDVFIARLGGFGGAEFFQAREGERAPAQVQLS